MKTASRILGSAFFHAGYEVQDAPHYGAERRGAPVSAYVRADRRPINERGIVRRPDLVVVAEIIRCVPRLHPRQRIGPVHTRTAVGLQPHEAGGQVGVV